MTKKSSAELSPHDLVTLMTACAIATEQYPHATEFEEMRQRLLKSAAVKIKPRDF